MQCIHKLYTKAYYLEGQKYRSNEINYEYLHSEFNEGYL